MKIFPATVGLALIGFATGVSAQTADLLVEATRAAHAGLKSYSAESVVTTRIDLTQTPAGKAARARGFKGGELGTDSAFYKPQTRTSRVSVKLRRDGRYRVEWEQQVGQSFTNKGAAWNAGEGDFIQVPAKGIGRAPDKETALGAASGFSGGASHVVASLFYGFKPDSLSAIEGLTELPEETLDGEVCYVLGGRLAGQSVIFWIRKRDRLIIQRRQVLGGGGPPPLTEAEAVKLLKEAGASPTPEAVAGLRKEREEQRETVRSTKGHITLTLKKISVNEPIDDSVLQPRLP